MHRTTRMQDVLPTPKLKILLGFMQIFSNFRNTYIVEWAGGSNELMWIYGSIVNLVRSYRAIILHRTKTFVGNVFV